ncbi:heavy-metal-associated domain-containing protein [Clostridium tyrobutyricum]|uniref:heavy-metal-associated domain-containing protein n=1 Tax=Clostridium tyrobutyricum TaxID=1519 RepID=UPI002B2141FF|nr:heavy-metal-associated domain-containing protein [Clostridium tyrobutyricum]MEA5009052.1 heavy-metal-associated domain-containing protein [Clostridium tyrobutyricum]
MKRNTLKFKEDIILCHRCVINAVKALSQLPNVEEFSVDINTKIVQVVYKENKISKEAIRNAVNDSIINGKARLILQ